MLFIDCEPERGTMPMIVSRCQKSGGIENRRYKFSNKGGKKK